MLLVTLWYLCKWLFVIFGVSHCEHVSDASIQLYDSIFIYNHWSKLTNIQLEMDKMEGKYRKNTKGD